MSGLRGGRTLLTISLTCFCTACFDPAPSNEIDGDSSSTGGMASSSSGRTPTGDSTGNDDTGVDAGGTTTGSADSEGSETSSSSGGADCDCGEYEFCIEGICEPASHVIYLNFDAEGTFTYNERVVEDATTNTHGLDPFFQGSGFIPYGDGPKREAVLEAVREDFAAYRVRIVDERPVAVPYSMLVFTGDNPTGNPNIPAMGSTDCNNAVSHSVYFMFLTSDDPYPAELHANLASRSIARGMGLDLVEQGTDVMYFLGSAEDLSFTDECVALRKNAHCPIQHMVYCDSGEQNAHAELSAIWGLVAE